MNTGSGNTSSANERAMTPPLIWLDPDWITVMLKKNTGVKKLGFKKGKIKCGLPANLLKGESSAHRYRNKLIARPTSGCGRKKMPPLKGETYLIGLNVMRLPAGIGFGESMPAEAWDAVRPGGLVT
jgi:hypothetical protein